MALFGSCKGQRFKHITNLSFLTQTILASAISITHKMAEQKTKTQSHTSYKYPTPISLTRSFRYFTIFQFASLFATKLAAAVNWHGSFCELYAIIRGKLYDFVNNV